MLFCEISPLALGLCVPQFFNSASVMSTLLSITRMHPPSPVPETPVSALIYPFRNPTPEKLIVEPPTMFISRCVPPPTNHERPKLALHILRFFPPETQWVGGTLSAYKTQRVFSQTYGAKQSVSTFVFSLISTCCSVFSFLFFSFHGNGLRLRLSAPYNHPLPSWSLAYALNVMVELNGMSVNSWMSETPFRAMALSSSAWVVTVALEPGGACQSR